MIRQADGVPVATNSGWAATVPNQTQVTATGVAVGAFALTDPASLDSALVATLPVSTGGYTATVASQSGISGYALTEIYDATSAAAYTPATPRLVNLSCLANTGVVDVGFVVGGSTALTLLVRASGPALAAAPFGLAGTMSDPKITVQPLNSSTILAANAGWGGDAQLSAVASSIGAFTFTSADSKDAALLLTLAPGLPYTVEVASAESKGGLILVEIYEVP